LFSLHKNHLHPQTPGTESLGGVFKSAGSWARAVTQVVERLPSKLQGQGSKSGTANKQTNKIQILQSWKSEFLTNNASILMQGSEDHASKNCWSRFYTSLNVVDVKAGPVSEYRPHNYNLAPSPTHCHLHLG
jgi:hypothetical protein